MSLVESNQHATLSITLDDPNGDVRFCGAMVDTFEMKINTKDIVTATMGIKARASDDTVYSAVPVAGYKWVGRDLVFKVADAIAGLAAATAISLKELTFTVNKNTDFDFVLGTLEPEDILNKQITIEGKITLNYEDRTWRNYMLNGTNKAIGITLSQSRTLAGDQLPTFYLELPKCYFYSWEAQRGNDEIVGQTLSFSALYDITTAKLISDCYVINDVVSY